MAVKSCPARLSPRNCAGGWRSIFVTVVLGVLGLAPVGYGGDFLVKWEGAYIDAMAGGDKLDLGEAVSIENAEGKLIGIGFPYSEERAKSPINQRYDDSKTSAVFYGVLEVINPSNMESEDLAATIQSLNTVNAQKGKNLLGVAGNPPAEGSESRVNGLIFWQLKNSSLEAAQNGKLGWDSILELSANVVNIGARLTSCRFAVQSNGKWYLAEIADNKKGYIVLQDSQWGEWPLTDSFPLPAVPETFPVSSEQLTNLTALGLYFSAGSDNPNANAVFGFDSFRAELNPKAP